jgi:hypothetical protein
LRELNRSASIRGVILAQSLVEFLVYEVVLYALFEAGIFTCGVLAMTLSLGLLRGRIAPPPLAYGGIGVGRAFYSRPRFDVSAQFDFTAPCHSLGVGFGVRAASLK